VFIGPLKQLQETITGKNPNKKTGTIYPKVRCSPNRYSMYHRFIDYNPDREKYYARSDRDKKEKLEKTIFQGGIYYPTKL